MFLRKTKTKGREYYQIVEKKKGKLKVLLHLGTLTHIRETYEYAEYQKKKNKGERTTFFGVVGS